MIKSIFRPAFRVHNTKTLVKICNNLVFRESSSSSSSSFDSFEDELRGENATAIWTMQVQVKSDLVREIFYKLENSFGIDFKNVIFLRVSSDKYAKLFHLK